MSRRKRILLSVIALCATLGSLAAQDAPTNAAGGELPHIAITGFVNQTGDESFGTPAATATDSLTLTLRMLGSYLIVAADGVPQNPTDATLAEWCTAQSVDYLLYGSIAAQKGGTQSYSLSVFDRAKGKTTIKKAAKGSSIFNVFSASDTLTFAVIDAIAGRHVGFGSIAFEAAKATGTFRVTLDGIPAGDSLAQLDRVVEGSHLVSIKQMRDKGSREIFLSEIEVTEGETTTVTVEIPEETTRSRAKAQGIETGLVFVEGGTFTMGSDSGPLDERPAHAVSIGSFWMSETEITQGDFKSTLGWMENGVFAQAKTGLRYPVLISAWSYAIDYCNARSAREGLTPAYTIKYDKVTWNRLANGYRLPTEAEWEYAAKGGTNHDGFIYPGSDDVAEVAIMAQTANGNGYATVGTKKPNSLGLYDMGGNVYEWCWDVYKGYRQTGGLSMEKAPSAPTRIIRGGDSLHGKTQVRCTARTFSRTNLWLGSGNNIDTSRNIGFRVVRSVMESKE